MTRTKTIIADLQAENMALLRLVSDIRAAVGDPDGKLMQDELIEHCKSLQALAALPKPEPVAYAYYCEKYSKPLLELSPNARGYEGEWLKVPLYASAPVQPAHLDVLSLPLSAHVGIGQGNRVSCGFATPESAYKFKTAIDTAIAAAKGGV